MTKNHKEIEKQLTNSMTEHENSRTFEQVSEQIEKVGTTKALYPELTDRELLVKNLEIFHNVDGEKEVRQMEEQFAKSKQLDEETK